MAGVSKADLVREFESRPALAHFLRLARRGKHGGASGGEVRCRELAEAVCEHAGGVDDLALEGLRTFVWVANSFPSLARELLDGVEVPG